VQSHLTNILFVYSVENPTLGYRQGMHELLAPIFYAVDFDSISESEAVHLNDPTLAELCSRTWVTADAYSLFVSVMRGVGKWYEWREADISPRNKYPLSAHAQPNISNGQVDIKSFVAPIVEACNRIQSTYLKSVDPQLWNHMQTAGIEPQIYGM
jgi:TBC1 domain family member 5